MYIGTDGRLYAEWWKGTASPAISAAAVDDGLWHHAALTSNGTSQTLTVDGGTPVTISGSVNISGQGSYLSFGAGYIGGNWPAEPYYQGTQTRDYFTGDIADAIYSYPGGP
jgi:Laminin G domain